MKKNHVRLITGLLAAVMMISLLSMAALAEAPHPDGPEVREEFLFCKDCIKAELECTKLTPTNKYEQISDTHCARLYECNNGHKNLRWTRKDGFLDAEEHIEVIKATCERAAICGNCKLTFGEPLGHTYGPGEVRKPTCFAEGATVYTCKVCGFKLETDKVKPLSHWYDVWEPAGAGLNSAPCKRPYCTHVKTTACVDWKFKMVPEEGEDAQTLSLCPVCGKLSDGGRLELVVDAKDTPVTAWVPEGDLLFRCGTLDNGEKIMAVSYEFDAMLRQYFGKCQYAFPAELVEGCKVMLLDPEGNETEMAVEIDGDTASMVVDFDLSSNTTGKWTPVRVLHLVPVETESK